MAKTMTPYWAGGKGFLTWIGQKFKGRELAHKKGERFIGSDE